MDLFVLVSIFVSIGGLLLTGIAVFFTIRQRKYPGRITFVEDECIGLVDSIVGNISDLEITYKKNQISERIVLLRGYLVNTGSKDISHVMIHSPLSMILPEGYQYLEAKAVESSPNVTSTVDVSPDSRTVEFGFELLKREEYIQFEVLVEVPDTESDDPAESKLETALAFDHRIADTRKVDKVDFEFERFRRKELRPSLESSGFLFILIITSAVLYVVGAAVYGILKPPCTLQYEFPNGSGNMNLVSVSPQPNGTLLVKGVNSPYSRTFTFLEEFYALDGLTPKIGVYRTPISHIVAASGLALLWALIIAIVYIISPNKYRKLKAVLEPNIEKQ